MTPGVIVLRLPVPPSTNHIYRRTELGGQVLKDSVRAFREEVAARLIEQYPGQGPMPNPPYRVWVSICHADRRKHDLDNSLKSLFDSLTRCLGFDDNDITEIHATKQYRKDTPVCVVRIEATT